ncbi:MAG TPA: DNRLRE domain-containing protein [Candidatus Udaeobacter sp.]|jgi:hypothetical protein
MNRAAPNYAALLFVTLAATALLINRIPRPDKEPTVAITSPPLQPPPQKIPTFASPSQCVLQPGPRDGKDIWTTTVLPYTDRVQRGVGGGLHDGRLRVGGWGDWYYSLIQFDLALMPKSAKSATLCLYCYNISGGGTPLFVDLITQPWDWQTAGTGFDKERLWWKDRPGTELWPPGTAFSTPVQGQWYVLDITSLYNAWQKGSVLNWGVQLRPYFNLNNNFDEFYSSNCEDPKLRPKLVVEF